MDEMARAAVTELDPETSENKWRRLRTARQKSKTDADPCDQCTAAATPDCFFMRHLSIQVAVGLSGYIKEHHPNRYTKYCWFSNYISDTKFTSIIDLFHWDPLDSILVLEFIFWTSLTICKDRFVVQSLGCVWLFTTPWTAQPAPPLRKLRQRADRRGKNCNSMASRTKTAIMEI